MTKLVEIIIQQKSTMLHILYNVILRYDSPYIHLVPRRCIRREASVASAMVIYLVRLFAIGLDQRLSTLVF